MWLYPLYDVYGNVKATLTRSGATGYSTANWKSYDVWGGERASTGSGSMFGYCGNLGHPTDPENGLIYMRARFYEPWTGRFLSEDPAGDGSNWYVYGHNNPTSNSDFDGETAKTLAMNAAVVGWFLYLTFKFFGSMQGETNGGRGLVRMIMYAALTVAGKVMLDAHALFDEAFTTLNKTAKAFGRSTKSFFGKRYSGYYAFYMGYGLFIAFVLDCISMGWDFTLGEK